MYNQLKQVKPFDPFYARSLIYFMISPPTIYSTDKPEQTHKRSYTHDTHLNQTTPPKNPCHTTTKFSREKIIPTPVKQTRVQIANRWITETFIIPSTRTNPSWGRDATGWNSGPGVSPDRYLVVAMRAHLVIVVSVMDEDFYVITAEKTDYVKLKLKVYDMSEKPGITR